MKLSEEQQKILDRADKFGAIYLGDEKICPGIHFCPDWDMAAICIGAPEAECCTCGRIKRDEPLQA